MNRYNSLLLILIGTVCWGPLSYCQWQMHAIDNTSIGADGVRLADFNQDGRMDIVTGWEEGGVIRLYLQPKKELVKQLWPKMQIGQVSSPEDAVFADLDGDGTLDVVSSTEGKDKTVWFHWADCSQNPVEWKTTALIPSLKKMQWMFCLPMDIDHQNGIDLVVGAKNQDAKLGWFESPENPRDASQWTWHPLCDAGWIMSILSDDVDGDGDPDLIISDRKGPARGVYWLENPGFKNALAKWIRHDISTKKREYMFLALGDLDADSQTDILAAAKPRDLIYYRRTINNPPTWQAYPFTMPETAGTAKGVAIGDIDLDNKPDVVFTCEHAEGKTGAMWMGYKSDHFDLWDSHDISGLTGTKYDLIVLLDLDKDHDLDMITCEERENLGVIWYENPAR